MGKILKNLGLPAAILAAGVLAFVLLASMRTPPARQTRAHQGPLVETLEAPAHTATVVVQGQGTVRPDREIDLVPQVAGTVVWMSPALEAGGFFEAGQELARIDDEDYQLAVEQAASEVARARQQLDIARGEADIARQEWDLLHADEPSPPMPSALVLRQPQLRAAEAALAAALARWREAQLHMERTRLLAPFRGRVRATAVDLGQYVTPGRAVARLYSTERAEIVVPVPDEELAWIEVPAPGTETATGAAGRVGDVDAERRRQGAGAAPRVTLTARYAGRQHTWSGRVARVEGEIDPRSRMVNVVVEVDDPYAEGHGAAPLMVGLFVDVAIRGRAVEQVRHIPREALHADGTVWLVDAGGQLRIRPARVVRAGRDSALVRFDAGRAERLVLSQLRGVTDGMAVRVAGAAAPGAGATP